MNILFSSGHPAQIHNFKYLYKELERKKHKLYWLATDKEISQYLLKKYNINYILIKKPNKSIYSKITTYIVNVTIIIKLIKNNQIELAVSRISPYVSLACFLCRVDHIGLTDTETAGIYDSIFSKMNSATLTSTSFKRQLTKDQLRLKGNIELFYLHPRRVQLSVNTNSILGIDRNTTYMICRFVSWDAYHDKGLSGFSDENKIKAVRTLSKYGRVFITSEKALPPSLEPYRIQIPPERMHDVLSRCKLFFGESATMASECAVLGRPAIFLDKHGRGYTDEEEEYGLVWNFKNTEIEQQRAIQTATKLLEDEKLEDKLLANHYNFLSNKIDMTSFMLWFIDNWPKSKKIMLENVNFQDQFI